MKRYSAYTLTLAALVFLTSLNSFAAPPVAKIFNKNGVNDGQRGIRVNIGNKKLVVKKATAMMETSVVDAPTVNGGNQAMLLGGNPNSQGQVQVLATQVTYGFNGSPVPIKLEKKLEQEQNFTALFQNNPIAVGNLESVNLGLVATTITFRAKVSYDEDNADNDNNHWTGADYSRDIVSDSDHTIVAIDGDNINDLIAERGAHPPYGNQLPISTILHDYIDAQGNVFLDQNRVLLLFEFNDSLNVTAADFQDAVVVMDLEGIVQAADVYIAEAVGSPHTQQVGEPYSEVFEWSMVRAAAGASRVRALAYSRLRAETSPLDFITYIHACVLTEMSQTWSDCVPTIVTSMPLISGDDIQIADMALTEDGAQAIGWLKRNVTSGLVEYFVSFSQNNGATWNTPMLLGSYVSTPGSNWAPNDIDLASNENGDIAVLAYFKQSGSPAPTPTEPNSLVLFVFQKGDQTFTPIKIAIAPGDTAKHLLLPTGCRATCFSATGDSGKIFHAFYYDQINPDPNFHAKVSTIDNGTLVGSPRLITNSTSVSTMSAAKTSFGVAFVTGGSGIGLYDIPTSGSIVQRVAGVIGLPGDFDDGEYSMTVRIANTNIGSTPSPGSGVYVKKMNAAGIISPHMAINDTSPYNYCGDNITNVGTHCYRYGSMRVNGLGGVVIGNTYYTTSLLTELTWQSSSSSYQTDANHKQRVVIHQTSAEP